MLENEEEEIMNEENTTDDPRRTRWFHRLTKYIKGWQIRVEVIVMLISICDTARIVVTPTLMLQKVHRAYQPPFNETYDEKFYNKKMVLWDQNYTAVNVPIACLAAVIFGAFSDRKGRRIPIMLGLLGMLAGNFIYILIWWPKADLRLEFVYLAALLDGLCGGFRLVISSINAYLSDQHEQKRTLSIRMIITYTILNFGDLVGSQLTNVLVGPTNEVVVMFVVELIIIGTILYTIIVVKDISERYSTPNETNGSVLDVIKSTFLSLWLSLKVVIKKRPNQCRLLLILTFICTFINRLAFSEEKSLIGTYAKLSPFHWNTNQYAIYKTIRPFVQILGLLFGLIVLKRLFKLRDTVLLVMSTLSMGMDALCVGLATSSLLLYASLGAGFMHALVNPLSYTLLSCLAHSHEMGKVFAVDTVVDNISLLLRTVVLQNIYTKTVDWNQHFIWFVLASMGLFSTAIFIVIHVVSKRNGVGNT
ncbi:hypothetical protein M3Y97_00333600 [Aphelenchoides bicaudatus]|nr:hypothetical protein M3Y97_00333600 [Aphelenchoides bicaudatus]